MKYRFGIIPTRKPDKAEIQFIEEHREGIIYKLVLDYLDAHPNVQGERTLWTAFKGGQQVRRIKDGKLYYIHSIQSHKEWEGNGIQTRYFCREGKDRLTPEEYANAKRDTWDKAVIFSKEEIEVVK